MTRTSNFYGIGAAALIAAWACGQSAAHAQVGGTEKRLATTSSNAQTGLPQGVNVSVGTDSSSVISVSGHRTWEDGGAGLGSQSFSVKASVPLNKGDSAAAFLTDGNLVNGLSLEFAYSRTLIAGAFPAPDVTKEKAYYLAAQKKCVSVTAPALADKACGFASERGEDPAFSARSLQSFLDPKTIADTAFYTAPLWRWGATGTVGYHSFDVRDPSTFNQQSEQRTDVAASVFLSRIGWTQIGASNGHDAQLNFAGGAEYKNAYAAAKSKTLCRTPPGAAAQECFTGAFGIPDRTETGDAFIDLKLDPPKDEATLGFKGLEVKATYDFEGAGAGVSGAVYLFGDGKGGRTGGLKASYLSDHQTTVKGHNFIIGVFTGLAFP
jgi:hypothetical protein